VQPYAGNCTFHRTDRGTHTLAFRWQLHRSVPPKSRSAIPTARLLANAESAENPIQ
jgi:hypothetical protein